MIETVAEGYNAHSQNETRDKNPYIEAAEHWDEGWIKREKMQQRHKLVEKELTPFSEFISSLYV